MRKWKECRNGRRVKGVKEREREQDTGAEENEGE